MKDVKQTIISNLKLACKAKKIRGADIAKHLEVSPGSVSNWFKGTNFIDIENLYKLCLYLGISLNDVCDMDSVVFDEKERQLIAAYRDAEPPIQKAALRMLEDSAAEQNAKKQDAASGQTA